MLVTVLFAVFPYIAIGVCLAGCLYRAHAGASRPAPSSWLEAKSPVWRWIPWQKWLLVIITGHLTAFLFPQLWRTIVYHPIALITIEALGITITVIVLIGLSLTLVQHLFSRRLIGLITLADLLAIALVFVQFTFGFIIIIGYRWSASWSLGTTTPYLWSVLTFHPDPSFILDMPVIVRAHVVTAWLFIFTIPFSNIRHVFTLPFRALERNGYRSVWEREASSDQVSFEARRHFLRGAGLLAVGGVIASSAVAEKLWVYVFGQHLDAATKSQQLETHLEHLKATVEEKELELERMQNAFILVAKYADLSPTTGKYFIDYQMRPAIAFKGKDGLPLLISAKCTHLGCTVGNQVNNGKILCPCHVTYFNVQTGVPDPGMPAKAPLPLLGWVVKDSQGQVVASKTPAGKVTGQIDIQHAQNYSVYIAREHAEG